MDSQQTEAPSSSGETVFNQEWNVNSPARIFANPRPLIPRAWERQARTRHIATDASLRSDAPPNKPRVIWKRYDYHSVALKPSHSNALDATRAVKKLKLAPEFELPAVASSYEMPCKWERRRSSLPHKPLHFSNSASSVSALVSPGRSRSQSVTQVQQCELPPSEESCPIETVQQSPTETRRTGGRIHSAEEPNTESRPKSSRSSFVSRRKTDFIFSRVPVASPSRKRRLSDTSDFSRRSFAVTTLYVQPSKVQDESEAKPSVLQQVDPLTSHPSTDPNAESVDPAEPVGSPRIAAIEDVLIPQQPDEEASLTTASSKLDNMEVQDASLQNEQTLASQQSSPSASSPEIDSLERNDRVEAENCSSTAALVVSCGNQEELLASETPEATSLVEKVSDSLSDSQAIELVPESNQENANSSSPSKSEGDQEASTVKIVLNDDDTDILHDFLNRAKASKAAKIAEQSSELNRRDSDIVKSALSSPRKPLDELDTNSPSPRKQQPTYHPDQSLDAHHISEKGSPYKAKDSSLPELPTEANNPDLETSVPSEQPTRRSKRNASAPSIPSRSSSQDAVPPSTISLRRQDQTDPVVLKKTEIQELALLTRTNTRRNKGSAVHARFMLERLKVLPAELNAEAPEPVEPTKVRWSEKLVAYFQESNSPSLDLDNVNTSGAAAESLDVSKPRARRAKMLGAMNGTPAKQRTKDMNAEVLLLGDNAEEDLTGSPPAEQGYRENQATPQSLTQIKTERKSNIVSRGNEKLAEAPQQQPSSRTRKRLPTPAKPVKTDVQEHDHKTARTRQNTVLEPKPTTTAAEDKENRNRNISLASKPQMAPQDALQSKGGMQPATTFNTVGEARRRPEPTKKAAATSVGSTTSLRASGRLRR